MPTDTERMDFLDTLHNRRTFITNIVPAILVLSLSACTDYKPGGSRNQEEIKAHVNHLRASCKKIGMGVEGQHGGVLAKSDIFMCPDGSIGFIPAGLRL